MRFFLTGFMGCGKSFWGQKMATHFNISFFDLDVYIEQQEKMNISTIFVSKGEDYFREKEAFYLQEIIAASTTFVMATGGGTPCFYENIKAMNESGITIYLNATSKFLLRRLQKEKRQRPLIELMNEKELVEFINIKLKERDPFYLSSNYIVEADSADETIFARIISKYV